MAATPPAAPPPAARPARPSAAATAAPRSQLPLTVGAVLTVLIVIVFLGGVGLMTLHYLMSIQPPPPV